MRKSQLFALGCLAFIGGIILSQLVQWPWDNFYNFATVVGLIILIAILGTKKNSGLTVPILFGTAFLLLGIWRFGLSQPVIDKNHIANYYFLPALLFLFRPQVLQVYQKHNKLFRH